MEMIVPLSEATEVIFVGGKAKSLGKLIRSGFNVPAGFVVTTKVVKNDLEPVLGKFDELEAEKVAVRSSAVAEDGTKDAWAGQMETFLNVTRDKLINKVATCFESAKTDRAKAYAKQKKIKPGELAVIVQKMVPADVSGVAFSAHPVTADKDKLVIEATSGLGEKLVSGAITPDTYIVDKKTAETTEEYIADKQPSLDGKQLKEITQTVTAIEQLFGFPVDVEWAYSNGELFILQSRPITTVG